MKPDIIVAIPMSVPDLATLGQDYTVHHAPRPADRAAMFAHIGAGARALLTNGTIGLSATEMAMLPQLGIVACQGAGFENVDRAAARARGITVTHGPGTNAACVADHAFALLATAVRGIPAADSAVRGGAWAEARGVRPALNGKRLGIFGLGTIGTLIARRAAGFEMAIFYHNRRPRPDISFPWQPSLTALAAASDFLVIATPGGAGTRHAVNAEVLAALGPGGFVVNIGRGSVIDTPALIAALTDGTIAGAALDVFEGEPDVPAALRALPNVVLTPHIAGRSPESAAATLDLARRNFAAYFAGRPVLTPVPAPVPQEDAP